MTFTTGNTPSLPGFTVMRVDPPSMPVEEIMNLVAFNPDADPDGYPFVVTRPDLRFSGRLYLQSEDTFDPCEYNGYLTHGDTNLDGVVDFNDFALFADVWTHDMNTAGPISEDPIP